MPTFASMLPKYTEWLKRCQIKPNWQGAYDRMARYSVANRAKYQAIEDATGVPWAWVAAAHMRESGGNFKGVLHNGEHIIGTGRKTRLVPAGHGPFETWEEAAIHAVKLKGLDKVTDWTMERLCWEWERFNGLGYAFKGRPSPYLWAGTNIYVSGKYVRDGVYDPGHVDTQLGCVGHYLRAMDLASEKDLRNGSRKMSFLSKVRTASKAIIGGAAGIFTMDNITIIREFIGTTQGMVALSTLGVMLFVGIAAWWAANTLDGLIVDDHKDGRYEPSGTPVPDPDTAGITGEKDGLA